MRKRDWVFVSAVAAVMVVLVLLSVPRKTELPSAPTGKSYILATPTNTPMPPTGSQKPQIRVEVVSPTNCPPAPTTPVKSPENASEVAAYSKGKAGNCKAEVNGKHGFKPWTSWTAYTAKSKPQYKLLQEAEPCVYGIMRVQDPAGEWRYCIALGTKWAGGTDADIGRCIDVKMANGWLLKCVLADVKKVEDTVDCLGLYGATNNDCLEFIVSPKWMNKWKAGVYDCSQLSVEFQGDASEIRVLDLFIEGFGE